jgi:hypothetical protein
MSDEGVSSEPDSESSRMGQAARLQLLRVAALVGAIIGATLPSIVGFAFVSIADWVITAELTYSVTGTDVNIFFLAQAGFTVEIIRELLKLVFVEEPEVHKIDL